MEKKIQSFENAKKWYMLYAVNTAVLCQMLLFLHLLDNQDLEQSYADFEQCNDFFFAI